VVGKNHQRTRKRREWQHSKKKEESRQNQRGGVVENKKEEKSTCMEFPAFRKEDSTWGKWKRCPTQPQGPSFNTKKLVT